MIEDEIIGQLEARNAELEQMVAVLMRHEARDDTIKVQRARIAELKSALEPFAAVCDVWEDGKTGDNAERYFTLRVGDLRAARAAMGEKE